MSKTSKDYIEGIKEGRKTLKLIEASAVREVALRELEFCRRVKTTAYSKNYADFIEGLRDFWRNQLTKINHAKE